MTNTTVITALGKEIGATQGEMFKTFRERARSFLGKHAEAPEGSPVHETVRTISKILTQTKGSKFDDRMDHPWETVAYAILFGDIKRNMAPPAPKRSQNEGVHFKNLHTFTDIKKDINLGAANAKADLERHLRVYFSTLNDKRKAFERNSVTALSDKKRELARDLHDYKTGIDKLHQMARTFVENHTETGQSKSVREKQIAEINTLASQYEVFLKDHAPEVSKHIRALDDNAVVTNLILHNNARSGGRLSSLFIGVDDARLRENLTNLKTKLGDMIEEGLFSSFNPKTRTMNALAASGQRAIDNLVKALDNQQAAQGLGLMALHYSFKGLQSDEASMAIWDACFGVPSATKVRESLSEAIIDLRSRQTKDASRIVEGTKFIIDMSFKNDYERLEGFTPEQRRLFRDLDAIASTQPHSSTGVRTGYNYSVFVEQRMLENLVPALQNAAIEQATKNYQKLDSTTEDRIKGMRIGACPYTAFEKEHKDFIASVVEHLESDMTRPSYIKASEKLHTGLRERIHLMAILEDPTTRKGPVIQASHPSPSAAMK